MNYLTNIRFSYMNSETMSYWDKKKERLKKRFRILTDKDLDCNIGKEDEMIDLIGCKLGMTRQELLNIILDL